MSELPFDQPEDAPAFDGETYEPEVDHIRLGGQALKVWTVVRDGEWRTLAEIEDECKQPQASVSARLRDFRKKRFGEHTVNRRRVGPDSGLFEYQVIPNAQAILERLEAGLAEGDE